MTKKYIFRLEDMRPEAEDYLGFVVELSDEEVVSLLNERGRYYRSEEFKKYDDDLCGEEQWMVQYVPDILAKIRESLNLQADELLGEPRYPLDQYNIHMPEEMEYLKGAHVIDGQLFFH